MRYDRLAILIIFVVAFVTALEAEIKKSQKKRNKELKEDSQSGVVSVGILDSERKKMLDKDKNGKVSITEQFIIPEDEILKKIKENDKDFSKSEFSSWIKALITHLFDAWSNNDLKTIRLYVTNNYFVVCKEEIEQLKLEKKYHIKNIEKVKGLLLKEYNIEGNIEILKVAVTIIVKDYITSGKENDDTDYKECEKPLLITFIREKGVKSNYKKTTAFNCPNCGAVLKPNLKATCDYCGVSVNNGKYNWAIDNIEDIIL